MQFFSLQIAAEIENFPTSRQFHFLFWIIRLTVVCCQFLILASITSRTYLHCLKYEVNVLYIPVQYIVYISIYISISLPLFEHTALGESVDDKKICTPARRLKETSLSSLDHVDQDSPKWYWVPQSSIDWSRIACSGGCWLWVALCTLTGAGQNCWRWFTILVVLIYRVIFCFAHGPVYSVD